MLETSPRINRSLRELAWRHLDESIFEYLPACGYCETLFSQVNYQSLDDLLSYLINIPYLDCVVRAASDTTQDLDVLCVCTGLQSVMTWLDMTLHPSIADKLQDSTLIHSMLDKIYAIVKFDAGPREIERQ